MPSIYDYVQGVSCSQVFVVWPPNLHGVGQKVWCHPAWRPCRGRRIIVLFFTHGILIRMDPDREEEILLNVAAGLDPLTAIVAATGDEEKSPKPQRSGCLAALLLMASLALAGVALT